MANAKPSRSKPARAQRRRPSTAPKARAIPRTRERVAATDIQLIATKGTKGRGGGPDGESWRIELAGRRAGLVFINLIDQPPLGPHASIQIYLNRASQGCGIGRIGYQRACELSRYSVIYAHMQKSNLASAGAAAAAGFVEDTDHEERQKLMVWRRPGKPAPPASDGS